MVCSFQPGATPLHAAVIAAAMVATVAAAGPDDPWAPDSARRVQLLLTGSAEPSDDPFGDADAGADLAAVSSLVEQ